MAPARSGPSSGRLPRLVCGVAAVGGFVVLLYLARLPVPEAVSHFVVEDAGYYLTTARNVVAGRGVTLDGRNATNGFHPLWLVVLCAETSLFGGAPDRMFHVALTTCVLLFTATCLVVCRDVRDLMSAALAPARSSSSAPL
jgi:hypothetical protein